MICFHTKPLLPSSYTQSTIINAHIPTQYCGVKRIPAEENVLWQEAPVHCPLKQKLTAQIERPAQVAYRIHQEERQA